jgi:NitT/TauT family transport system substrate-binding protein
MVSKLYTILIVIIAGMIGSGCATGPADNELQDLTLQLNWTHEAEFAGFYVADEKGFYRDAGLNVTIKDGGIGVDEQQLLLDKQVDVAVLTFNDFKTGIGDDQPVTTVAAIFQIPPPVFFSLEDSGIETPRNFTGRRIAVKDEGWREILLNMLTNAGVDVADVEQVDVNYDEMQLLFDGDVDVWSGYLHDEITEAKLNGHDVNIIFPYEYGVGDYEGLLVLREETLTTSPETIQRFVNASVKGWQYAIENPDETAEIIGKWQPDLTAEFHQTAFSSLAPLVATGANPIGWIEQNRWMQSMGEVVPASNPGYTLEFLEAVEYR